MKKYFVIVFFLALLNGCINQEYTFTIKNCSSSNISVLSYDGLILSYKPNDSITLSPGELRSSYGSWEGGNSEEGIVYLEIDNIKYRLKTGYGYKIRLDTEIYDGCTFKVIQHNWSEPQALELID